MQTKSVSVYFSPFLSPKNVFYYDARFVPENVVSYMLVNKKSFYLDIAIEIAKPEKLMVFDISSTF